MLKLGTTAEVKPPYLIALLHVVVDTSEDPDAAVPDPAGMVITRYESPCTRPGPCLQVEIADVVQNTVMPRLTTTDV